MQDRVKSCEEFAPRVQKHLSQAEVVVTGAMEHRDRMKVEFEEGQRRFADLQTEAQNHLREFFRWWRWRPKSTDHGNMWPSWKGPVLLKSVLVCASVCPRLQGLGFFRPCRFSCQRSSSSGWRIDKQISKRHCVRVDIEDDSKDQNI